MKIAYIGGGSILWGTYVARQLIRSQFLGGATLTLMDIDPQALELNRKACHICNTQEGSPLTIETTGDLDDALQSADFVIVSITTGGLDAMRHDIEIPERYAIYHTVGDTVGPAGWARAMRNIHVFHDFGRRMQQLCPDAWMLNVSNPLTVLTRTPHKCFDIKSLGLCHGLDNTARSLAKLAGATGNANIDYVASGIDHGTFFTSLSADGMDILETLKQKGFCRSDGKLPRLTVVGDSHAETSQMKVACALWRELGYMPAISDRHLVENYPWFVTHLDPALSFGVKRTSIDERWQWRDERQQQIVDYIEQGKDFFHIFKDSHDPICEVIEALCGFRSYITGANYRNIGQIPSAPADAVVETRCRIDRTGVHPMCSPLPDTLKPIVMPTIYRQEKMVDIALSGTFDELVALVLTDPLCSRMSPADCRQMMRELLEANQEHLPNRQFLEGRRRRSITAALPPSRSGKTDTRLISK